MLFQLHRQGINLVGVEGFEPSTSRTQTERTTRLCYTPKIGGTAWIRTTVATSSQLVRSTQDLKAD
jgi:hypothetical protein